MLTKAPSAEKQHHEVHTTGEIGIIITSQSNAQVNTSKTSPRGAGDQYPELLQHVS